MIDLEIALGEIESIVLDIAKLQLKGLENKNFHIRQKESEIDLVTNVDIQSEKMLKDYIWTRYPDHAIIGEEDNILRTNFGKNIVSEEDADYIWVIDPIDGTTNYIHSFPFFSISVGLKYKGQSILGLVYAPCLDYMFTAIKGKGAQLNKEGIVVSNTVNMNQSVVATGFPYNRAVNNVNLEYFAKVVNEVAGIRRTGSAALDLCFVASGMLDGYWEFNVNEWDTCAGLLILEEAKGCFNVLQIKEDLLVIASNKRLYKTFYSILMN